MHIKVLIYAYKITIKYHFQTIQLRKIKTLTTEFVNVEIE